MACGDMDADGDDDVFVTLGKNFTFQGFFGAGVPLLLLGDPGGTLTPAAWGPTEVSAVFDAKVQLVTVTAPFREKMPPPRP